LLDEEPQLSEDTRSALKVFLSEGTGLTVEAGMELSEVIGLSEGTANELIALFT